MKRKYLKFYAKIVAFVLSLFGLVTILESCDEPDDIKPKPMYGVPTADFVVKSNTTETATSNTEIDSYASEIYYP